MAPKDLACFIAATNGLLPQQRLRRIVAWRRNSHGTCQGRPESEPLRSRGQNYLIKAASIEAKGSMKILITRGSGLIGTNLVSRLTAQGQDVVNFDIARPRYAHQSFWQEVDMRNREALVRRGGDFPPIAVVRLGARTDLHGPSVADCSANTGCVRNLIDAMQVAGRGSRAVLGLPRLMGWFGRMSRLSVSLSIDLQDLAEKISAALGFPAIRTLGLRRLRTPALAGGAL